MTSRTIGLAIRNTSTAISTTHSAMLGSRNASLRPNAPRATGCARVAGTVIVCRPRHGRACPGHPRLVCSSKTWMPGTRPGMTNAEGPPHPTRCARRPLPASGERLNPERVAPLFDHFRDAFEDFLDARAHGLHVLGGDGAAGRRDFRPHGFAEVINPDLRGLGAEQIFHEQTCRLRMLDALHEDRK